MNEKLPRLKKSQFVDIFAQAVESKNIDRMLLCTQISLLSEIKDNVSVITENTEMVPFLNEEIEELKDFIYRGGAMSLIDYSDEDEESESEDEISDSSSV